MKLHFLRAKLDQAKDRKLPGGVVKVCEDLVQDLEASVREAKAANSHYQNLTKVCSPLPDNDKFYGMKAFELSPL